MNIFIKSFRITAFSLCIVALALPTLTKAQSLYPSDVDNDVLSISSPELTQTMQSQTSQSGRGMWDIAFRFNGTAGAQVAVATDGTHFFLGNWQTGAISRFDMDGNHIETFTIPGVPVIRSLTYDGTYFYAGNGTTSPTVSNDFYKLDLTTKTLVETINAGGVCRHLCYDPTLDNGNGGFWHGDWTNVRAITMTGTQIYPSATVASVYGSGYDPFSDPDHPCLWLFAQTGSDPNRNNILQWDIKTRALTGVSYNVYDDIINPSEAPLAGGAFCFQMDERWVLAVNVQMTPNQIIVYELSEIPCLPPTNLKVEFDDNTCAATLTWIAAVGTPDGYNIYRDGDPIATNVTGTQYVDEDVTIDVEYTWTVTTICDGAEGGSADVTDMCASPPPPPCNPVTGLKVNVEDETCFATLTWTAAAEMPDATYNVYRDGTLIQGNVEGTTYIDDDETIEPDVEYTWTVKTVSEDCEDGESTGVDVTGTCFRTGIIELDNNLSIYPNPVSGMVTIKAEGFAKVEVYNTVGQLIETKTVSTFDVSTYNTGIYLFKVYDANGNSVTKRVMVTK